MELVQALVDARRHGSRIAEIDDKWTEPSAKQAFFTMLSVSNALGWEALGWKVAATQPEVRAKLRTDGPVLGMTFKRFAMPSPAVIELTSLDDPIIECELMFRLARPLTPRERPYTEEEVAEAVSDVFVGIEIGECRFVGASRLPVGYLMADGFGSGHYVLGSLIDDWRQRLELGSEVTLSLDGVVVRSGTTRDVLGHPLRAVVWLANRLSALGQTLESGQLISSGTCTGMYPARRTGLYVASFAGSPSVYLTLV